MNCISCNEEISNKFKHALSQNVCPFCGKDIIPASDHIFKKSIISILRNRGINDDNVINGIIDDLVALINSDGEETLIAPDAPDAQQLVVESEIKSESEPQVVRKQQLPVIPENQSTEERVKLPKPTNARPPRKLGFKAGNNDPISTGNYRPPSESMDVSDITDEIGAPTPEEIAEIEAEVASGKIVFSPLR